MRPRPTDDQMADALRAVCEKHEADTLAAILDVPDAIEAVLRQPDVGVYDVALRLAGSMMLAAEQQRRPLVLACRRWLRLLSDEMARRGKERGR